MNEPNRETHTAPAWMRFAQEQGIAPKTMSLAAGFLFTAPVAPLISHLRNDLRGRILGRPVPTTWRTIFWDGVSRGSRASIAGLGVAQARDHGASPDVAAVVAAPFVGVANGAALTGFSWLAQRGSDRAGSVFAGLGHNTASEAWHLIVGSTAMATARVVMDGNNPREPDLAKGAVSGAVGGTVASIANHISFVSGSARQLLGTTAPPGVMARSVPARMALGMVTGSLMGLTSEIGAQSSGATAPATPPALGKPASPGAGLGTRPTAAPA